jgi:hypothetical protein
MTPEVFVAALKESVRRSAATEADYLTVPPGPAPPAHLARFSAWFRGLPPDGQEVARDVIRCAAEGSLFVLLTYLDNLAHLTGEGGEFEVFHRSAEGRPVRLNDPEGDLLTDLFNNLDDPPAPPDRPRD